MKIAYFIDSMKAGGKERQLSYLVSAISLCNSVQLYIFDEEIFFDELFSLPIDLIVVKKSDRYRLKTLKKINSNLCKFKPDVIHYWDNISQLLTLPYVVTNNVKVINGSIRYGGATNKSFKNRVIKKICFKASDIIVANSFQGLKAEGLIRGTTVQVIYNGLNSLSDKDISVDKKDEFISILNKFTFNILMVGRFQPAKDYDTFVRVAKKITANNPNIAFHAIGDGPYKEQVELHAIPQLNKSIFFWGQRSDVRSILHLFDIGVLLSNTNGHAEGLSNAIMEYMQSGLPAIATEAGGTTELIENGVNGYLVAPFDVIGIENKINTLLSNNELRDRIGINNIKKIKSLFNISKMIDKYNELYISK